MDFKVKTGTKKEHKSAKICGTSFFLYSLPNTDSLACLKQNESVISKKPFQALPTRIHCKFYSYRLFNTKNMILSTRPWEKS